MFRSATFKLTLWYLAIAMAISILFSVALYHVTTVELNRGLHRETERISRLYPVFQGDPGFRPPVQDYETSAHRILLQLIGLNIVVLVGAGYSSYWLARRTLEPIEAAHEQQKRFTADVSHELRTPLTALRMESEVALLSQASAADLRKTITSNLEEVAKLESLINNLLRLSSLEADDLQHDFTDVSLQDIIETAIEQTKLTAQTGKVTVTSKPTDLLVNGDQASLVQLMAILIDNAIKYSSTGQTVAISARRDGENVKVQVKDHGIGIEPSAMEHIFDRFYRADSSRTKTAASGFGLGLSIAKLIADIHMCTITLTSSHGKGTTATVQFPAAVQAK